MGELGRSVEGLGEKNEPMNNRNAETRLALYKRAAAWRDEGVKGQRKGRGGERRVGDGGRDRNKGENKGGG